MIRLWNSTETAFRGNRWVLNETTKCDITEVTNGEFAADLEYPLKDTKDLSKNFLRGNLITCPVADERPEQQFRIRKVDKTSSGVVVYAQAKLIADLGSNYIRAMTLTGLTRKQAIQAVLNAALEPHSFVVGNLDTNTNNGVIVNIQEGTVLNALIGKENSILSEYGGEFIINNNTFDIVDSRGANRKFRIAYGKNIASIKETIDDTDLATVLIPKSGDYRLPEYYIESPNVNKYEKRYFQEVDMNLNIWDGENEKGEDQITLAEAHTIMRTTCNNMFLKDKVDQVAFNYAIDLIALRKTEEYKYYNIVEKVYLGDTVTVDHKLLNIDLEGNVNKTVYNVLLDKYNATEIGFTKQDITDIINSTIRNIKFTEQNILLKVNSLDNKTNASIELLKNQITERVTEEEMWSLIQLNPGKILLAVNDGRNGTDVLINIDGLEIHKGKFRIYNIDGEKIFGVNQSGRVLIYEMLEIANDVGDLVDVTGGGIKFWNYDSYLARVDCISDMDGMLVLESINGDVSLKGNRILINGTSLNTLIANIADVSISNLDVDSNLDMGWDGSSSSYEINNVFYIDGRKAYFTYLEANTMLDAYNADIENDLWVGGSLDVEGSKPCLQITENYGKRRVTAYETAEYYFGDIGEGIIKDGECIVTFEDIFSECVNTNVGYQVFTQIYNGAITRIERFENYFIVYGQENTEFSWEVKAKRKGYENVRLEEKIDLNDDADIATEDLLLGGNN